MPAAFALLVEDEQEVGHSVVPPTETDSGVEIVPKPVEMPAVPTSEDTTTDEEPEPVPQMAGLLRPL